MHIERIVARITARIGIVAFFVMAFEIMIMISPFAFFFYSVFNPVFHWLDQFMATRWLVTFFLPHMILPPTLFLKAVRVFGSVCFVVGALTFVACAIQVYVGKVFARGIASGGLYRYIRHPQYAALGLWGIGMSILWPRFIVLASLSVMFVLYYFLARDEERRMVDRYGPAYKEYLNRTGMFVPKVAEAYVSSGPASRTRRYVAVPLLIIVVVIGSGAALRELTLHSLPYASAGNVTLVSMLPEDNSLSPGVLRGILKDSGRASLSPDKDYLGYVMPVDYVMQGMIADTESEYHLYKQHHTVSMIAEWVLHPFQHLRASPSLHMAAMHHVDPAVARRHHCPIGLREAGGDCAACSYRRVILVDIEHPGAGRYTGARLFSVNTARVPVSFIDINARTGEIIDAVKVRKATAWEDVPTPAM